MTTRIVTDTPGPQESARAAGWGPVLLGLFFLSGAAALVYQVLWVRELGLLFGSTAQAAAMAIAIFFAGLAVGGWVFGRQAASQPSPLRTFGMLELAVAATATGHFLVLDAYEAVLPWLGGLVATNEAMDLAARGLVAATVLFPPAMLMGGTLPMLGQHVVRDPHRLGRRGSALYAVNTLGGAVGALAAGSVLPLLLGFRGAYLLAIGLDVAVGVTALVLARPAQPEAVASADDPLGSLSPEDDPPDRVDDRITDQPAEAAAGTGARARSYRAPVVWGIAFGSGVVTLGLEVVWTRVLAQVLQNSSYTYAVVLATFLAALSLGALLANALTRLARPTPGAMLRGLLLVATLAAAFSPWLIHDVTDGLSYLGGGLGWTAYLAAVSGTVALALLLPAALLGTVLPYLLRLLQGSGRPAGEVLGRMVAINTAGGILGALLAGFVLLPVVGAWRSALVLAAVYPALLIWWVLSDRRQPRPRRAALLAVAAALLAGCLVVQPDGLRTVTLEPGQRVVDVREGPAATVAVVRTGRDLTLRVNNSYTLGGTQGVSPERNQAVIPMLTHTDIDSVFFLGLGTGLTAGAALPFEVQRVVVCELLDDVVAASRQHFAPWTLGLFTDDRTRIIAEDGRACLRRFESRYDLIISDLFTPWDAGTGNLYTLEHYRTARERLQPGGAFVQWIPLYQVSPRELAIIGATMDAAFEQVSVWRGDLHAERSIVALVGYADADAAVDPAAPVRQGRQLTPWGERAPARDLDAMALRMYAGNASASGVFDGAPLNTDDRPLIERLAPATQRRVAAGEASFVTGQRREDFYRALRHSVDPAEDPYLRRLSDAQLGEVRAGHALSRSRWQTQAGQGDGANNDAEFQRLAAPGTTMLRSPAAELLPHPP